MTEFAFEVEQVRRRRRARRRVPAGIVLASAYLLAVITAAAFGRMIAPQDPDAQSLLVGLARPSGAHWFGTDDLGRDIASRTIAGARTALLGPLIVAAGAMLLGNVLGLLAGYRGGRLGSLIMRWVESM